MVLCLSKGFPNWIRILLLNKHASQNWIQFQCLFFFLIWYNGFLYEKHIPLLEMSNGVICTILSPRQQEKLAKIFLRAYILELIKQCRLVWSTEDRGSADELLSSWDYLLFHRGHLKVRLSSTLDSLHTLGEQRFGARALTKENRPDEHPSLKGATCESKT